jgi:HEPN domain-containing protein
MKIHYLKKRAEDFLKDADFAISEKRWNSAAFHLEQFCQLYLKYLIFKELKDYPKIHDLEELLGEIAKVYGKKKEIEKFIKKNASEISALNQAYITARYLPIEFTFNQIREMKKFTQKLIKFLEKICEK